ncbi:MAG: hypothetical protein OEO79_02785 [Gemmatimonadota bacterium]|nr:hypothetical protein [Gemmatimonadota bacterium]MDH3422044.1 hypothetical protein [Gemmatimonadota bacterium]
MRARPLFRVQALFLVALVGVLASALPSHHHEGSDVGPVLEDAGHHGHGVQLIEQANRLTAQTFAVALPTPHPVEIAAETPTLQPVFVTAVEPVARGRPPPSDRPRAPPVSV